MPAEVNTQIKRADKRKESTQNKKTEIMEPDARRRERALLCMTDAVLRTRCRLTHVAGHKECCRLRNGVNTIFFAAWLLTTLQLERRRHLRPPAQPSAFSPQGHRHRHRHSLTSDCCAEPWAWLTGFAVAACYGSTVFGPWVIWPSLARVSGTALHDAGCRSCSVRLRLDIVRQPIDGCSQFREPDHSPPNSPSADP